jgi:hypothetical protein
MWQSHASALSDDPARSIFFLAALYFCFASRLCLDG